MGQSMNKEGRINFIKVLLFVLLVYSLGSRLLEIFSYKDMGGGGGWQRFYQEGVSSADVYFVGSSHAHCTIDHGTLWEEYGIAGFTLSAGFQQLDASYHCVQEILRVKHPEVIMVEVLDVAGEGFDNKDEDVYRNSLGMKWSGNLWEYVCHLADNMGKDRTWRNGVFTKIPIIHSRYNELTQEDFQDSMPYMRGYRGDFLIERFDRPTAENNRETSAIHPDKMEMLVRMVEAAREEGVSLVFFAAPYYLSEEEQMKFNAVEEFARENEVPFLNFNHMYDDLELDFAVDFRDVSHLNNDGAKKVTRYIAEFLEERYEIPDRRGEEGYELWDQNARYLHNKGSAHELESAKDVNEYLQVLPELWEEKTVILALTGYYGALGDVYVESLEKLGISREEYELGGAWVFRNGEMIKRLPGKDYTCCMNIKNGEIHLESSLHEEGQEFTEEVLLMVNGKDYRMVENGVNVIVYDEDMNQFIDIAGDDVYLGLEMAHWMESLNSP